MAGVLKLGRVAGVPVGLHWSALGTIVLLFVVVTAGLGHAHPEQPAAARAAAGLLGAALFMGSLLAHEIAHAVVAKRNGVEVQSITLWLLGGVAQLRGETPGPRAEFTIAVVGPAVSLASAVLFGIAAWALAAAGAGAIWVQVIAYLAGVNMLITAFNLIPAAPLDGGRLLRAVLWAIGGDRLRAAVWAARMGRGFGMVLLALGALGFLFGYGAGVWWLLLGLFILVMAAAEERQAQTGAVLAGVRVRDLMTQDPDTVSGDLDVESFLRESALLSRHAAVPVLGDDGRFEGLITLRRLRSVPADRRASTTLEEAALPPSEVPVAGPDDPVTDLLPRLASSPAGRGLVFSGEQLVGIVSPSDVSRAVALRLSFGRD